jgi:hypothetical protein
MDKDKIEKEVLLLMRGKIDWHCQCPPERRGAEIALLHVLGMSWEKANKFSFDGKNMEKDYQKLFLKLRDGNGKA